METFNKDDRIRISKLKRVENYRPWAIYVQATLKSRRVWDIILSIQVAPVTSESHMEKLIKDACFKYLQKHISAKEVLILSIAPSIQTDKCTTRTAKEICDYYSNQYKEEEFVLWFTLFVYLITSKVSFFRSITKYNADFKITLDKHQSSGDSIPDDLK